jgi:hypothetical protein
VSGPPHRPHQLAHLDRWPTGDELPALDQHEVISSQLRNPSPRHPRAFTYVSPGENGGALGAVDRHQVSVNRCGFQLPRLVL